jgi:hypothetical protein
MLRKAPVGWLGVHRVGHRLPSTDLEDQKAARWYWEFGRAQAAARAAGLAPPAVSVPVGFTTFPGEIWAAPRS